MTTAQQARHPLGDALRARLKELSWLQVYDGEIPSDPPRAVDEDGQPDPSGRVAPYAVVYTGGGIMDLNPVLSGGATDYLWSATVTFAAGYASDLESTLDRAHPHLHLWRPTVPGLACGLLRPPPGLDPGPLRRNEQIQPARFWLPTQWVLHVTTDATTT